MHVGVGYSDIPDSILAGKQAAQHALEQGNHTGPCDFALLFSTARHHSPVLRDAVASIIGQGIPIYGGGAVGIITNETYGYAGDQVGIACIWMEGAPYHFAWDDGLLQSEEQAGMRLGQQLRTLGTTPDTPVMLFYDAVDVTGDRLRLLMATWILAGLEKGLGFLPDLNGMGMQGDHVCSHTDQFVGDTIRPYSAMALSFPEGIQVDTAIMHGCRPASPYYTVTKSEGPVLLEINGEPAIPFIDKVLEGAISPAEYPFFLLFGINHGDKWAEYDENNYASRLCTGLDMERNGIVMFEPDMVPGTEFQIMFRSIDLDYMKPKINQLFDQLEGREPVFAMYIDCAGRCAGYGGNDMEDAVVLQQMVHGRVPLLGLYNGVEIASIGGRPRGLDWTGVFCLFSQSKDGTPLPPKHRDIGTWESTATRKSEQDGINYPALVRLTEKNAAKILALDTQSITIRHELEQKRRGFSLLAELSVSLRNAKDFDRVFIPVARRINAALNMQKTVVLRHNQDDTYTPDILQGYAEEEKKQLEKLRLTLPRELLDAEKPVLLTAADAAPLADFRQALHLPNLISTPVVLKDEIPAVLVTGRIAEQPPFLSRLGPTDVETVQAIGALLGAILVRQQLDASEERNRIMLDSTPLSATFWDKDHNHIDCNQAAVHLFGLSSKQEYLDRFAELSPEFQPNGRRSVEVSREKVAEAFRVGRCVFEWTHQLPSGEPIPSEVILVRVKARGGDVVVGYTNDLRELKANMAEIERTQEDLREARDRAEESSRAKSNFLANMSHEIRTPMNAIIGMTEIAKTSDDPERMKYCLSKIEDASAHLLGIINDILDMSKIDAGKLVLSATDFTMEDMLQRVSNVINFKVDEKEQHFVIKVDKDVPSAIVTDQQRLTQVITNLLSNAVKFTPEDGKIALLVHKKQQEGNRVTLHFEVIDSGIGISEEQKAKLFQSFVQADGSISRRFGGTGLGLAISKNIVEMLGGEIWVDSTPGAGSNFQFTVGVEIGAAQKRSALNPNVNWKNIRLLVVDDDPDALEYFTNITSSIGVYCKTAPNAYEACRILDADDAYHIIFVDWKMPGMDGIQLTEKIREKYGDQMVVVMISAVAWSQIESKATAAGVDRFIAKPLLPSAIVDCINECMGDHYLESIPKQAPQEAPTPGGAIFAGKHILLAEDIEINQEILIALLADTGITIDCAENGNVVCQMFHDHPDQYDLILMDIHMPEMDGYEATSTIRAMDVPRAHTIPIIAMTANVFKEDIEHCLAVGMNDHVGKPLNIEEVIRTLKKYL